MARTPKSAEHGEHAVDDAEDLGGAGDGVCGRVVGVGGLRGELAAAEGWDAMSALLSCAVAGLGEDEVEGDEHDEHATARVAGFCHQSRWVPPALG